MLRLGGRTECSRDCQAFWFISFEYIKYILYLVYDIIEDYIIKYYLKAPMVGTFVCIMCTDYYGRLHLCVK